MAQRLHPARAPPARPARQNSTWHRSGYRAGAGSRPGCDRPMRAQTCCRRAIIAATLPPAPPPPPWCARASQSAQENRRKSPRQPPAAGPLRRRRYRGSGPPLPLVRRHRRAAAQWHSPARLAPAGLARPTRSSHGGSASASPSSVVSASALSGSRTILRPASVDVVDGDGIGAGAGAGARPPTDQRADTADGARAADGAGAGADAVADASEEAAAGPSVGSCSTAAARARRDSMIRASSEPPSVFAPAAGERATARGSAVVRRVRVTGSEACVRRRRRRRGPSALAAVQGCVALGDARSLSPPHSPP